MSTRPEQRESVLDTLGPEKCVSCAACVGTGRTLTGATCPRCDGRAWFTHGWACSGQHEQYAHRAANAIVCAP